MWGAAEDASEGDHREMLWVLVENDEFRHHVVTALDPVKASKLRMEQRNLSCNQHLESIIGTRGRESAVLNHPHSLSLPMICKRYPASHTLLESLVHESRLHY